MGALSGPLALTVATSKDAGGACASASAATIPAMKANMASFQNIDFPSLVEPRAAADGESVSPPRFDVVVVSAVGSAIGAPEPPGSGLSCCPSRLILPR